jgi:hypothetical protein
VEKHIDGDKHEGGKSVEGYCELSLETRIEKREERKMKKKKRKKKRAYMKREKRHGPGEIKRVD